MTRDTSVMMIDRQILRLRRRARVMRGSVEGPSKTSVDLAVLALVDTLVDLSDHDAKPVGVKTLAEYSGAHESVISRLVTRSVDAGYLERDRSNSDARKVAIRLTDNGRELYRFAAVERRVWLDRAVADWSADDLALLARLLERLTDALTHTPGLTRRTAEHASAADPDGTSGDVDKA